MIAQRPELVATGEELKSAGKHVSAPSVDEEVDPFDIGMFPSERAKFREHFAGNDLEIMLRSAVWLMEIEELRQDIIEAAESDEEADEIYQENLRKMGSEYRSAQNRRDFLAEQTQEPNLKRLILAWYIHFDASKTTDDMERIYAPYRGHETILFNRLYKKYVDDSWPVTRPLWKNFDSTRRRLASRYPEVCQTLNYLPPAPSEPPEEGLWSCEEEYLRDFAVQCLVAAGAKQRQALEHVKVLQFADSCGIPSCGLGNLDRYVCELGTAKADANQELVVLSQTEGTALVDGKRGLGGYVGSYCMDLAMVKAKENGVACVACRNSGHFGPASYYTMKASDKGLIGIVMSNAQPAVCPTRSAGGPALGANPIACAARSEAGETFSMDMATSALAPTKLLQYTSTPENLLVDFNGLPTRQSAEALGGGLLPLGGGEQTSGFKGYGLGLMVEMLCSVLVAGTLGPDMEDWTKPALVQASDVSQCFIVIDPAAFDENFSASLGQLISDMRGLEPVNEEYPVLIPGDPELEAQKNQPVYDSRALEKFRELSSALKVKLPKFKLVETT